MFDLRVDRGFNLARGVRVRGFVDLFNITNSNAAETRTITTGTAFLRPTAVLAPRTARIGARFQLLGTTSRGWGVAETHSCTLHPPHSARLELVTFVDNAGRSRVTLPPPDSRSSLITGYSSPFGGSSVQARGRLDRGLPAWHDDPLSQFPVCFSL